MKSRDKSAQPIELIQSASDAPIPSDKPPGDANPYRPAIEIETAESPPIAEKTITPGVADLSVPRTILRWTVVCVIAAAPSFFFGVSITQGRVSGMIAAILTFIGLYVGVDLISRYWPIRSVTSVRRTLVFVYVSRILVSVFFPIGTSIDVPTGMAMASLMGETDVQFRNTDGLIGTELACFWLSYRMTFLHAILMNIVLVAWGLIAFPFVALISSYRKMKEADKADGNF